MSNTDAGKGDTPRPISVDQETFERNWERVFGRKIARKQKKDEDNDAPSDR